MFHSIGTCAVAMKSLLIGIGLLLFFTTQTTSTRLSLVQDVTITDDNRNNNHVPYLIVGLHPGFANKRSLLQFTSPPGNCRVGSAKLYLNFAYAHKGSAFTWRQAPLFPRTIVAHRVLKPWSKSQATAYRRLSNANWSQRFLGFDTDILRSATSPGVVIYPPVQRGQRWYAIDVTSAVRDWASGQPNYGLLIRAKEEDRPGRDFRFYRNNAYIQLTCAGRSANQGGGISPPIGTGKVGPNGELIPI